MLHKRIEIVLFFCFSVLGLCSYAGTEFSRKEYLVPFHVDSDVTVPVNAVFSCNAREINKIFSGISSTDPEYIKLARKVHRAIRVGDIAALKQMAFPCPNANKKIEEDMEVLEALQIGGYQKYSDKEIAVRAVVNVMGSYFVYCLAVNEKGEAKSYVYIMRCDGNGRWFWDPLDNFCFGDIQAALFAKFVGIKGFSASPQGPFSKQTFLVGDSEDDNYVSCNCNLIDFTEGVPVTDAKYMDLLSQLHSYWTAVLTGKVEELSGYFDKKSFQTMLKESEKVGYIGANGLLNKTISNRFRMTHIIYADPVVVVFYATNKDALSCAVFTNKDMKIKRIRYHYYGESRELFQGIVSKASGKKIELWVH